MHSVISDVRKFTDAYDFTKAVRLIQDFVIDEVSNWYVRRSRRRFWAFELTEDKIAAYRTLYQVLVETSKLIAPFAPYLAEELYTSLKAGESVHLELFPVSGETYMDKDLERKMRSVIDVVSLGRAARNDCQIKVRQPLGEMFVPAKLQADLADMLELVKEEVNIHKISFVREEDGFVQYELKPDFKVMGPKYGKLMKAIGAALAKVNGADALASFAEKGSFELSVEAEKLVLLPEDLVVHILPREGYVFANQKDIYVAMDTRLSPELLNEGYARELVNKIQFTRKELGLEIMDSIEVRMAAPEVIVEAVEAHRDYIMSETLATSLVHTGSVSGQMSSVDINGHEVHLAINKVSS